VAARRGYRVRWTPEAEDDAADITDSFDDDINAHKVLAQFQELADRLGHLPERGRIVPELRPIGVLKYRELIQKPWRMLYLIDGLDVWIMAVLDGRRDLQHLLFERLART
jgi:plasmid stabilization system protein ParE